jgi:hypothetical protein
MSSDADPLPPGFVERSESASGTGFGPDRLRLGAGRKADGLVFTLRVSVSKPTWLR